MPNTLESVVSEFVEKIRELARRDAQAEVLRVLSGQLGNTSPRRPRAPRRGRAPKGGKRSPAALDAMTAKILAVVKSSPGLRVEQIGEKVGAGAKELALPMKRLLAEKKVKKTGERRGTKYFPGR